ncbi:T9SS type B sorting domain-containing protein [uncultured Maribacter sp.]|uniref:T9SS type B sorting domain-containing protein n=1 Tax=uncultured Maribacter sp. TaxID=431308 RepID=UPI0026241F70|nr:T9SS type B sorting domain-containing protein [uncultured Maribacter sp.]
MSRLGAILSFLFVLGGFSLHGQVYPDCSNAVPICNNTPVNGGTVGYGVDDFNNAEESGCLRRTMSGFLETNSAWYRFRTGASGQLGFNIGFDVSEDWDFALYKASDCNALGEPVRCNFFDNADANSFMGVGVDPTGDEDTFLYEDWLQVEAGEDYYLLLNNFSNTNSGFSIQFSGDIFITNPYDALDCSIINNLLGPPISACDTDNIVLDATTVGAVTYEWFLDIGTGFSRIPGENGPTLTVAVSALYRVVVVMPTSGNIISEAQVAYSPSPITNSLNNEVVCSDDSVFSLALKDVEALGGQSPDDFRISYHLSLTDAMNGARAMSKDVIDVLGTHVIYVRTTSIENSSCFDVSEQFTLEVIEEPVLNFPNELFLCANETSGFIGQIIPNTNYSYLWNTGETTSSIEVFQEGVYTLTATQTSNGVSCSNTESITVVISELPRITDVHIDDLQSNNVVTVTIDLEGEYEYQLDDGEIQLSNKFQNVLPGTHSLTVIDPRGCGAVTEEIVVVGFDKFFTPNADGFSDIWHIDGIYILQNPQVYIYDRYGKLIKHLNANSVGWDGTYNGVELPSSDYWFKLTYEDENGQSRTAKYINNHFSLKR